MFISPPWLQTPGSRSVQFVALIDTLRLHLSCFGVQRMAMTDSLKIRPRRNAEITDNETA